MIFLADVYLAKSQADSVFYVKNCEANWMTSKT